MILICPKCARRMPLSEDDVSLFYPRFFCLSCGEPIAIPITPEEALRLARLSDRDRKLRLGGEKDVPGNRADRP